MDISFALFLLPGLIIGLTVHEASHAISAKWLGDSTAEKMGRVSLNPLRHLSPMGTLALFFLGFGWGKPVIVNLYNFKRPKFYYLLSSLAGPVSNLLLAGVALGLLYLEPPYYARVVCVSLFMINSMLAVFNLLPIPPLDGSKIWPCLIPGMRPVTSGKWNMIWFGVVMVCIMTRAFSVVLFPVLGFSMSLMPDSAIEVMRTLLSSGGG